jgi:alkyl hydroperoxide reductase subunit AhpC
MKGVFIMDYELMMNGNVKIGDIAPNFNAVTTQGNISLEDYKGKWVVLFSHPGDFTPVCTTEMIAFAKADSYFKQVNACLIGLSIDSNSSHLAWMYDIYLKTGTILPFPLIADRSGEIARKYGMISTNVSNTETVRNVYIIDPEQVIRAILVYPMNIGRNISEILRIIVALQTADENAQMTPADWMPCESMIVPMPHTFEELQRRVKSIEQNKNGISWYLSFENPKICENVQIPSDNSNINYNQNQIQNRNQNYNQNQNQDQRQNQNQIQSQFQNSNPMINQVNNRESNYNANVREKFFENKEKDNKINENQNNSQPRMNRGYERRNNTIQWNNFR